ncbi:MAG: hypothetical protein JNM56_09295 [Planctomycetia bacterium]|nr:hypothetical protein [Planctomycetia bacterium]
MPESTPAKSDSAAKEALSEAQRDFAKVLGRLLAQRWHEEHRQPRPTTRTSIEGPSPDPK